MSLHVKFAFWTPIIKPFRECRPAESMAVNLNGMNGKKNKRYGNYRALLNIYISIQTVWNGGNFTSDSKDREKFNVIGKVGCLWILGLWILADIYKYYVSIAIANYFLEFDWYYFLVF